MKPATPRLFDLRDKLRALVERGVNGEKIAAELKLKRLEDSVDFSKPVMRTEDIFAGHRIPFDAQACFVCDLGPDRVLGDFVKWALESGMKLSASWRANGELWACIPVTETLKVKNLATGLQRGFSTLWEQFAKTPGVFPSDKTLFLRGLWDGCMEEQRKAGEALPTRIVPKTLGKTKKSAVSRPIGLNLHPYQIAAPLGKQLRFSASIEEVCGELNQTITRALTTNTTP